MEIKFVANVCSKLVDEHVWLWITTFEDVMALHALVVGVVFVLMKEIMTRTLYYHFVIIN